MRRFLLPATILLASVTICRAAAGDPPQATQPRSAVAAAQAAAAGLEGDDAPAQPPPKPAVTKLPVAPAPIPRPPANAAQMLEYFDIDASVLRQLIDHRPLHPDEHEALVKILYALPRFPLEEAARWIEKEADWNAVIAAPQQYRTRLYHLAGQVVRVDRVDVLPEAARRLEFEHYYQAEVKLGKDGWTAVVCARQVPKLWKLGEPISEAVSFDGMFLKLGDHPLFAAARLAWHPNRLDEAAGIAQDHIFLGDLDMDVGLWDDVADGREFVPEDRECFYQLLAAMKRTRLEHLVQRSTDQFSVVSLLREPEKYHGRLLQVEGVALRAVRIAVNSASDADIRERFGIDHYYEIYVMVTLEGKIAYVNKKNQKLEFSTVPVVFCVRELPGEMPEGENIYQPVRIAGPFFKLWAYADSAKMRSFDPRQQQKCPMFIGLAPQVIPHATSYRAYVSAVIGGLFVLAMVGVWLGVWRMGRGDAQFARETLLRQYQLEPGKSLDHMGIEAKAEPDFRHLAGKE